MGQDAEYTEWNTEISEEYDDEKNEKIKEPPFWFLVKKLLSLLQQSFRIINSLNRCHNKGQ